MFLNACALRSPPVCNPRLRCRALFLGLLALGGVGGAGGCNGDSSDGLPEARQGKPIVTIGSGAITAWEYRRALHRAHRDYAQARGITARIYYEPPHFRVCVRDRRPRFPEPGLRISVADLRRECREHWAALRDNTLEGMIEQRWLEREARRWNIDPVPADGVSRFVQLRTRLVRRASRRIEKVTETEIARYYSRHRPYFYQPELRDGVAILLLERSTAQRAKRELERGVAWATVARTLGAYAEPERLAGRT